MSADMLTVEDTASLWALDFDPIIPCVGIVGEKCGAASAFWVRCKWGCCGGVCTSHKAKADAFHAANEFVKCNCGNTGRPAEILTITPIGT